MVPSAYLRVFQPLESFQPEEQARWERYLIEGAHRPSFRRSYRQRMTTGRLGLLAPADGGYRLTYLTLTRRAMRRAERAVPALRGSELGPIADLILELHEWLSQFDPRSLLELDYARLCDLMTWDELDDDHSARDLHEALLALTADEFPRSAELYQGVAGHWAEVRN